MSRNRVRSSVPVFLAALAVLALAICLGLAKLGASDLLGSASAAGGGEGPVAEYAFDEGEGATVEDLTGNGHAATIEGASWTPRGRYGSALDFDSSEEDVVKVPDAEDLDLDEEFTLEAWVRPTGEEPEWAPVIDKQYGGGEGSHRYAYFLHESWEGADYPAGGFETSEAGKDREAVAPGTLIENTWQHLAITFDGATLRLYVNGQLAETTSATGAPQVTGGELQIGGSTEHGDYFDGRIDEVRIYGRALSGSEVGEDLATPIATPPSGPVAAYAFDEGEGTTAADASGSEHDGTLEAAEWERGRYGSALGFDGEESCVSVPDSESLQLSEEFTLEAWVRPLGSLSDDPIVFKEDEGGEFSYALGIGVSASGKAQGYLEEEGEQEHLTAPSEIDRSAWTHLAFSYDGATLRLYEDGQLVATDYIGDQELTSTGPLYIGCDGSYGEHFEGRIDEPRLYDRALNGAEIGADMAAPIQTPQQGPVAEYAFDEGEGETVEDLTGGGHTATIEAGEWVKGKYGTAIGFDGKGGTQCLQVADAEDLRLSEEFTLEAWVRPEGGVFDDPVIVKESEAETAYGLGLGSREEQRAEGFIGQGEGSEAVIDDAYLVPEHTWTHFAVTYDGAYLRIYDDGELTGTEYAPTPPPTGEGAMKIGCDIPDGQFTGRIDEARIYNRALSEAEVKSDLAPIQTPQQGPVASYSLDEDKGETAEDLSGGGHTATVEGADWTAKGRFGGAYEFDASEGDLLRIPYAPELDFSEEFTLEAWVRPSGAENKAAPLIAKQAGGGLGYFLYEGGTVSDRPEGAASEEQELIHAEGPLDAHAWSHVALVFNGNRTFLYVNGELVDNGAAEPIEVTEGDLEIGGSSETSDYFDGRIDEVRIYNRALDPGEMAVNEGTGIQTPHKAPIAAYSFDEGEGTTVEDLTGDGHTATIEGAEWTRGKYGDALKFDGKDQLTIPASEDLNLTEAFTLEAWIRPEEEKEFGHLFVKEDAAENEAAYVITRHATKLGAYLGEPEAEEFSPNGSLGLNVWQHVAVTFDGAQVRLYVNGELEESGSVSKIISTDGALRIGGSQIWPGGFTGRIDEVRIYDRALSTGEVLETMNSTFPVAITEVPTEVASEDAIMTGTAQVHGPGTEWYFEYGPTTEYDSIATGEEIDDSGEAIELEEAAVDLAPETTYHYRLIAEGPLGTSHGKDKSFKTGAPIAEEPGASKHNGEFFGIDWTGDPLSGMAQPPGPAFNDFSRIAASGAKFVRFRVSPSMDPAEVEEAFKEAKRLGLTALPYIGEGEVPQNRQKYFTYAKKIIKEYGPSYGNDFWEIGNEPNMPPSKTTKAGLEKARDFAVYFEEMVSKVKNENGVGNVKFLLPGLFSFKGGKGKISPRAFLKQMKSVFHHAKPEGPEPYDGISVHPYVFQIRNPKSKKIECKDRKTALHPPKSTCDEKQIVQEIKQIVIDVHNIDKNAPVWVTEFGFPVESNESVHPGIGENEQGVLAGKSASMLLEGRNRLNIAHVIYYNIRDLPGTLNWAYNAGLFDEHKNPRKSWTAFKEVVKTE